jgi:hypothetical protein
VEVMGEQQHTCDEPSRGSVWQRFPCGKKAKFRETKWGKESWFCGMHAPSEVQRRRRERAEPERIANAPRIEAEHKARLIRDAATDLLKVCRKLSAGSLDVSGSALIFGYPDAKALLDEARAAIAKAEGR